MSSQMGPPGGRSTGRPSPPPTTGRHFSPDRKRAPEGSAPATRREPGRSTTGRRLEREQGGRGATPPPPPAPPPARRPQGPRPPPPEAEGTDPPRPGGEPGSDPPRRPSRRLQWGPRGACGPTPAHRDAAQIVPREAGWARTGMVWVATPPMDSTTPRGARFVAYPGKAAPQPANH